MEGKEIIMKRLRNLAICFLCVVMSLIPLEAMAEYGPASASAETSLAWQTPGYVNNVAVAAAMLDGVEIGYGERFSFNETVGARSRENGYRIAENGRGARVRGGGVSQVASTLNLAAQDFDWVSIEEYYAYGDRFVGSYVEDGELAVVTDYDAGHDYAFTSWYPGTVVIEAWVEEDVLCCALTGYEDVKSRQLGKASTPMPDNWAQANNILLSAAMIDGFWMQYGDSFSFNEVVGPRSSDTVFEKALNGRGVKVVGGGVAQVASTIYLALKQVDSIVTDPVRTYGDRFTGTYVDDSADAVLTDYTAGIDFAFSYYGSGTATISLYEMDGQLYCEIDENY